MEVRVLDRKDTALYSGLFSPWFLQELKEGKMIGVILQEDGLACGGAAGKIEKDSFLITSFYVEEEYRREGGGRLLFETLKEEVKKYVSNITVHYLEQEGDGLDDFFDVMGFEEEIPDTKYYRVLLMVASTAGLVHISPEILKSCLKDNGDGTVTVRLYQWQEVRDTSKEEDGNLSLEEEEDEFADLLEDDMVRTELRPVYIKISKEVPRIAGSDPLSAGALWMQMIEKAAAFLGRNGIKGYQSLWYGEGGDFLEMLLGISKENKMTDLDNMGEEDRETLFRNICNSSQERYVYHCGTKGGMKESDGLNSGHAYTVMGGKEVEGEKYILLRNPYGTHSQLSKEDGSKTLTGTALTLKSDETYGQFYIKYEEFLKNFASVSRTNLNRLNE